MSGLPEEYARNAAAVRFNARRVALRTVSTAGDDLPMQDAEITTAQPLAQSLDTDLESLIAAGLVATVLWQQEHQAQVWASQVDPGLFLMDEQDERFYQGLSILRTNPTPTGQMVGRWLSASHEHRFAAAGHLTHHLATEAGLTHSTIGQSWWLLFGSTLVTSLAQDPPASGGRPSQQHPDDVRRRQALKAAVRALNTTHYLPKQDLAELARISRPTLNSWLS